MRKFIISDFHGNGDVYDSIMGYLDNMSADEKVKLYINGDLIDRGLDSYRIFFDVFDRINGKGRVKIYYLGGNHESLMYKAIMQKGDKPLPPFNDWIQNGGRIMEREYLDSKNPIVPIKTVHKFLGNLDIYHLFDERVGEKRLLLVHAQVPENVSRKCTMKIKDADFAVDKAIWTRETDDIDSSVVNRLGKKSFFTIIGHTPIPAKNNLGYFLKEDWMNIDGGCARYACGHFESQYVPLVEVLDGELHILTFNHNNEIVAESYFDGEDIIYVSNGVDKKEREKYIDHRYDGQASVYQKSIRTNLTK